MEKLAVCALIKMRDGKVLAVSRKDNQSDFGLPGGKVDYGETNVGALHREILEETGYSIINHGRIFASKEADGYLCITFLCEIDKTKKRIKTNEKETGLVKEVTWDELKSGSFSSYNTKLYNELKNKDGYEWILK